MRVAGSQRATIARGHEPALAVHRVGSKLRRVREALVAQLVLPGLADAVSLVGEEAPAAALERALDQEDLGLFAGLQCAARRIGVGLAIGPGFGVRA